MKSQARRLAAVEARTGGPVLGGSVEVHFGGAWPACLSSSDGIHYEQCTEHEPGCAVSVGRRQQPGRAVIILGGPWLGV